KRPRYLDWLWTRIAGESSVSRTAKWLVSMPEVVEGGRVLVPGEQLNHKTQHPQNKILQCSRLTICVTNIRTDYSTKRSAMPRLRFGRSFSVRTSRWARMSLRATPYWVP